ncbi:MAG: glycosyltransferase family 2 protein [Eubacterium sp.]
MEKISIIIPCYNEELSIPLFYDEMTKILTRLKQFYSLEFEYIFIDDGSSDKTLERIKCLFEKDKHVKYISFSRNFGKEAAIYAGIEHADGDYIALIDADLQDPPHLLEEMYLGIVKNQYDCVAARRVTRKGEPAIRSFFARCFYKLMNKMSKFEIVDGARDFRLMTKQMAGAILKVSEYNRFSKGIFSWVGFKTKWLEYENIERAAGETKWTFCKLLSYSIEGIVAYSTAPLSIASFAGVFCCVMICIVILKTLIWGDPVAGYPSMICVIFFIGGIQLFCMGILGQYLAKTYLETKRRPIYLIKENSENTV